MKIEKCPFCGGTPILELFNDGFFDYARIRCCRVMFDWCGDETGEKAIAAWNSRVEPENEPMTRCENCTHWDKSISFMMSAHACSYWSPSKRSPRYTEGFEFCSFASAKPERSEGE